METAEACGHLVGAPAGHANTLNDIGPFADLTTNIDTSLELSPTPQLNIGTSPEHYPKP